MILERLSQKYNQIEKLQRYFFDAVDFDDKNSRYRRDSWGG